MSMTAEEWLACTDPLRLLEFLQRKISERKLRLFAAGCCRQLWGSTPDEATRTALAIVEHLAEAGILQTWRGSVRISAGEAVLNCGASEPLGPLSVLDEDGIRKQVAHSAIPSFLVSILEDLACLRSNSLLLTRHLAFLTSAGFPPVRQASLLRDIVRGPLLPIRFRASWKTWNSGVCFQIAQEIYKERLFDQLPILGDALEEAGCTDADILNHCRQPGEHVRGCWILDLLLGKS
jgi:hypothetical protein